MSIASRRLVARLVGSAAVLVAAALPVQGGTAVRPSQAGTHASQIASGIAAGLAGSHGSLVPLVRAHADSRFDSDVMHHWSPP